eukprot:525383_1
MSNGAAFDKGSFHDQFHNFIGKIGVVSMMNILAKLYQNENIALFDNNNDQLTKIFIKLYSDFHFIEDNPIRQKLKDIIKNEKPNKVSVEYDYSANFPFSKCIHHWCSSKLSVLCVGKCDAVKEMTDESRGITDVISDSLTSELSRLYVKDVLSMKSYSLETDPSWPKELYDLITEYIIVISKHFCGLSSYESLCIIELETAIFYEKQKIYHLIKICSILPTKTIANILKISNC